MFELLSEDWRFDHGPGIKLTKAAASLLFLAGLNLSISSRQSRAVSLRNAASEVVVWDRVTLPITLKLSQAAPS